MKNRIDLHELLCKILGTRNVYFQPPETVKMEYPCIVYKRNLIDTDFADDKPYKNTKRYSITVIDKNPDSEIPDKVAMLPMCRFDTHFTSENLNHDTYNIYY